jgi:hypothetical protein
MNRTVICWNAEERISDACLPTSSLVTLLHKRVRDHRLIVAVGARISMLAVAALVCAMVLGFVFMLAVTLEILDLIRFSSTEPEVVSALRASIRGSAACAACS